jgi:HK97 family phage prohead protease
MDIFEDKGFASRFVTAEPYGMPSVAEVHESADGTGLEVSGWFATWDTDSEDEAFLPKAFSGAIKSALAVGLPVLFHHAKADPPIGYVRTCEERPGGLWGSVILPRPTIGTKAYDIYAAVKSHLLNFFSVGGLWHRTMIGGKVKLGCKRLLEVSLTSQPANVNARTARVSGVVGVKSIGAGVWIPESANVRVARAVEQHAQHRSALADLQVAVGRLHLRSFRR